LINSKADDFKWNLVIVYGDAQQSCKAKFLIELVHLIRKSRAALMLAGDFNMTRRESDKNKPGGYNKWSILFNYVISQGELMEIKLSGRQFTWSKNYEVPT
jgi:exonuclease III